MSRRIVPLAVTVLLLAACSPGGSEEPTAAPTAPGTPAESTRAPEPSPTETAEPGPVDRTDPELGIAFEGLPDVTGPEADAVDTYTALEVAFWSGLVTNELDEELDALAAPDVAEHLRFQVESNVENGWVAGGELTVRLGDLEGNDQITVITACSDVSEMTFTQDGRTQTAQELDMPSQQVTAEVSRAAGPWLVTSYELGEPC